MNIPSPWKSILFWLSNTYFTNWNWQTIATSLLALNRSKLILSMWNTLSTNLPCVFFITSSLLFSLSFSHFPLWAIYSLPQLLLKDVCLPREASIAAGLLVAKSSYVFFLPAVTLVCRPVVTFSFTAPKKEDVHTDRADTRLIVYFSCDDTYLNTQCALFTVNHSEYLQKYPTETNPRPRTQKTLNMRRWLWFL